MMSNYPKEMRHPHYRPAVISGYRRNADGSVANDPPGSPSANPPVWVNNYDQELYYASLGYLPVGVTDSKAYFDTVGDAAKPKAYSHVDYPKWMYRMAEGRLSSVIVNDPDEMQALGEQWHATPGEATEAQSQGLEDPAEVDQASPLAADAPRAKRKYTRHSQAA